MLVRTFLYLEVIKSEIDQNAKNIIQTHVHLPVANEIASGLLAKMSAVSQTPQTKQKKKFHSDGSLKQVIERKIKLTSQEDTKND